MCMDFKIYKEMRLDSGGRSSRSDRHRDRSPRREERTPKSSVIGVFGLDLKADERDLYSIFNVFGNIKDIQVVYDNLTGKSRGFAFVYFKSTEDAEKAVEECRSGISILGKTVRVDFSKTTKPHEPTPGVYMGHERGPPRRRDHRRSPSPRRRAYRRDSPERHHRSRRYSRSRSRDSYRRRSRRRSS